MALDFNREWASSKELQYPTDAQRQRGLAFLGTEPPTFELHDAMFKELDKKDKWLYDQVRAACEKFGQDVSPSLAGGARDTMASAITAALLNQRKADEGGYGIVKMANYEQVFGASEYNLAVSPKHLGEYVYAQNVWGNIKDKPQTAVRWPAWGEVSGKPTWGSAAWKPEEYFERGGAAERLKSSLAEIAKTGTITDASGELPWDRVGQKPGWTNNIYTGSNDLDTVITSRSGGGKATISDEWLNFYPKGKGASFSVGPDGRIYNASISHDQVLGLGSAALSSSDAYDPYGTAQAMKDSLAQVAKDGEWGSIKNRPSWTGRIYSGSNASTGIVSESGKGKLEVKDDYLDFYPNGGSSKFTVDKNGRLFNCHIFGSQIEDAGTALFYNADYFAKKSEAVTNVVLGGLWRRNLGNYEMTETKGAVVVGAYLWGTIGGANYLVYRRIRKEINGVTVDIDQA